MRRLTHVRRVPAPGAARGHPPYARLRLAARAFGACEAARRGALLGSALAAALLAAAQPAAAAGPGSAHVHTLRSGETVWELARRYGSHPDSVAAANRIADARSLPVGLRLLIPPRPPPGGPPLADVDVRLGLALAEMRQARFDEALEAAEHARQLLANDRAPAASAARRAEIELVTATVELAYGRADEARVLLSRALQADPGLSLDASTAPPRLLRLLDEARSRSGELPP